MIRFVHLGTTIPPIRISQQGTELIPNLMFPIDSTYIPVERQTLSLSTFRWARDYHLGKFGTSNNRKES